MKKVFLFSAIALFGAVAALAAPAVYMKTLPNTSVAAVSNVVYREHICASGKVEVKENGAVVNAAVNEDDIANIAVGQDVLISGKGFGEYSGTVSAIAESARSISSGSFSETVVDVQISFDAYDKNIRDGFSAEAEIYIDDEKKIRVIDYDAVNQDEEGTEFVYVFENGTAVRRNIETGLELSEGIEVISGITDYDKVISSHEAISDGEYVKVVK